MASAEGLAVGHADIAPALFVYLPGDHLLLVRHGLPNEQQVIDQALTTIGSPR